MKKISLTLLFSAAAAILATGGLTSAALADTAPTVVPVRDIQPEYPARALRRDTSGYVIVRFDVDAGGRAKNINIVESQPASTFDAAVLTAVRRSTFEVQGEENTLDNVERIYRFGQESPDTSLSMNDIRNSYW